MSIALSCSRLGRHGLSRRAKGGSMQDDQMMLLAAIALGVVVLLAIVVALLRHRSQQRSLALRAHFGPEYERAIAEHGGRARAERVLAERQKRFHKLHIRHL